MALENSQRTSPNEENLNTALCPMPSCTGEGNLTIHCGDNYHYLCSLREEKEKYTDGLEFCCLRCQETGEEVLTIPEYIRKPQEHPQQFREACKAEFTHTKIPKVLWITKSKAQLEGKALSLKSVLSQLTEEMYSQYQKPGEEAEIFTRRKILLLQCLQPGQFKDVNVVNPEIKNFLRNLPQQGNEELVMCARVCEQDVADKEAGHSPYLTHFGCTAT
ncbi:hypothetical protein PR048_001921 [Dryococelus australis]|uniref:Zinc finger PHD-type domain-containing protein n=1 Tax=Dryococelus australis TaxID=614101 RepID=A0ABQ9IIT9_9NEOP|nr:hypothetical protein PR048_001921 [Dryococelus australis]